MIISGIKRDLFLFFFFFYLIYENKIRRRASMKLAKKKIIKKLFIIIFIVLVVSVQVLMNSLARKKKLKNVRDYADALMRQCLQLRQLQHMLLLIWHVTSVTRLEICQIIASLILIQFKINPRHYSKFFDFIYYILISFFFFSFKLLGTFLIFNFTA